MTDRQEPNGTDGRPVPDLVLERGRLGELPTAVQDALAHRMRAEPELQERMAALDRSDEELRRRLRAAHTAASVRARLSTRREEGRRTAGASWRAWPLPAGLAVAATLVLAVWLRTAGPTAPPAGPAAATPPTPATSATTAPAPRPPDGARALPKPSAAPVGPTGDPGVRLKGLRPALSLFRKTADGSETLADGDVAREGDLIRIGYRAVGRRYGVIVSLDSRGGLTRHLPERGATAALLEAREVVLLAHAYRLDDAPAWERFFFVTADAPFQVATVEEAARQNAGEGRAPAPADLPLPKALEQSTFLLTKESRP